MNTNLIYRELIARGYSPREAEEIIEEELAFEQIAQRNGEIEKAWNEHEKEKQNDL